MQSCFRVLLPRPSLERAHHQRSHQRQKQIFPTKAVLVLTTRTYHRVLAQLPLKPRSTVTLSSTV
jgi:hypothetical protein